MSWPLLYCIPRSLSLYTRGRHHIIVARQAGVVEQSDVDPYLALFERADQSGDGNLTMEDIGEAFDEWQKTVGPTTATPPPHRLHLDQRRRSKRGGRISLGGMVSGSRRGIALPGALLGGAARGAGAGGGSGRGGGGGSKRQVAVRPMDPMETTLGATMEATMSGNGRSSPAAAQLTVAVPAAGAIAQLGRQTATSDRGATAALIASIGLPPEEPPSPAPSLPPLAPALPAPNTGGSRLPPLMPTTTAAATPELPSPAEQPLPPMPKHLPPTPSNMASSLDSKITQSLSRLPEHAAERAPPPRRRPPPGRPPTAS